jgi:hypothetical protein
MTDTSRHSDSTWRQRTADRYRSRQRGADAGPGAVVTASPTTGRFPTETSGLSTGVSTDLADAADGDAIAPPTIDGVERRAIMKAIVSDAYGPADVLELRDIDTPEIADGEALIRVHAAGVDRAGAGRRPYLTSSDRGHRPRLPLTDGKSNSERGTNQP